MSAILLTLEPCFLHNLATRLRMEVVGSPTTVTSLVEASSPAPSTEHITSTQRIRSSFKYFLIECILRFIPAHLVHFPAEKVSHTMSLLWPCNRLVVTTPHIWRTQVVGFDVENFFRDIDVDDVKHLYRSKNLVVQSSAKRLAFPKYMSFAFLFLMLTSINIAFYRAAPRSKSFYYSFVDSPYFFHLLIEHGRACHQDYKNLLNCRT